MASRGSEELCQLSAKHSLCRIVALVKGIQNADDLPTASVRHGRRKDFPERIRLRGKTRPMLLLLFHGVLDERLSVHEELIQNRAQGTDLVPSNPTVLEEVV